MPTNHTTTTTVNTNPTMTTEEIQAIKTKHNMALSRAKRFVAQAIEARVALIQQGIVPDGSSHLELQDAAMHLDDVARFDLTAKAPQREEPQ